MPELAIEPKALDNRAHQRRNAPVRQMENALLSIRAGLAGLIMVACAGNGAAQDTLTAPDTVPERVTSQRTPDAIHPAWRDFAPRFTPYICPFPVSVDYDPGEFRCGYIMVPEDRTTPDSRLIRLSVLKITSPERDSSTGALIRLTGGPGGTSLSGGRILAYQHPSNASLRAKADLIFFDQRGTGYSEGAFCRAVPLPYQYGVPTLPDGQERFAENMRQCFDDARRAGIHIDGYTNWQNALDVRDIRRALGYSEWTLFGVSYGTELAQGVMQVDREGTRAAILDSVVPTGYGAPDIALLQAAGFRSALNELNAMCAAHPRCAGRFDDLGGRLVAAIASYDEAPLVLDGLDLSRAENGTLVMDGVTMGGAVFQAMYDARIYGDMPALLHALETRDADTLRAYVNVLGYPIDHNYGHGMSVTINCRGGFRSDPHAPRPPGEPEHALARYVSTLLFHVVCSELFDTSPDPTSQPMTSAIPALVVTGAADPITPPYYADAVMHRLPSGQRVDFPNTGHGALLTHWDACGRDLVMAMLDDPHAPIDASCAAAIPGPDFLIRMRRTPKPYVMGLRIQSGDLPRLPVLAGAVLVLILLSLPVTWVSRRFDGSQVAPYGGGRIMSWFGAGFSLIGVGMALNTITQTAMEHFASLPVGLPASIWIAGWTTLIGFLLCAAGLAQAIRYASEGHQKLGTRLALLSGLIASGVLLWFLFSIDAGPFML